MKPGRLLMSLALFGLIGAACLILFSAMQKWLIGVNPLQIKGYLVPVTFGVLTGGLLGWYIHRCHQLAARLEERLETLERFLPMCAKCKQVRIRGGDMADPDAWQPVDEYLDSLDGVEVSHGLCPDCACELYGHLPRREKKGRGLVGRNL